MLERVGNQGRAALLDTYRLWQEGYISRATFLGVASQLLEFVADRGADYGRVSYQVVAAEATLTQPTIPAPTGSASSQARIAQSIETVLEGQPDIIESRLARLGYVLPITEIQLGYQSELQQDDRVEGWERGLNADACQLCRWWHREGRIWPKNHPMPTHKGCRCQQVPKFVESIHETHYTRDIRLREEAQDTRRRQANYRAMMERRGWI